ncbi:MAG: hypothetical protein AAGL24_20730 [Pseudomonadota bacterium]
MLGNPIEQIGLGGFLFLLHLVPMLAGVALWSAKRVNKNVVSMVLDGLGFVATPVALVILIVVSEDKYPGGTAGHPAGWFLIFSMLTIGLLPLTTIASCFCSGRLIGRAVHWYRRRQWYLPG